MLPPSPEILEAWLDLVQSGRIKQLQTLSDEFTQAHPEHQLFVDKMNEFARKFQLESLEAFIQQFLE